MQANKPPSERDAAVEPASRLGIIEPDTAFAVVLMKRLTRAGWEHVALSGKSSPRDLADAQINALVVDLAAVGNKPWRWLNEVCQLLPELSVIVCTANSTVQQRVYSLSLGVDDWLSKPCHPEELLARVEATTTRRSRRAGRPVKPSVVGKVEIRPDRYQAFVDGRSLELTRREYQMLEFLALAGGQVVPREVIYESLWRREMEGGARSVDVCVHKLRRKLDLASPGWRYIETHYGVGYRLLAERVGRDAGGRSEVAEEPAETSIAA